MLGVSQSVYTGIVSDLYAENRTSVSVRRKYNMLVNSYVHAYIERIKHAV